MDTQVSSLQSPEPEPWRSRNENMSMDVLFSSELQSKKNASNL